MYFTSGSDRAFEQLMQGKNTSEIRNIKKYLLAMLFNAPSTINGYYAALVAHDMNTGKI